MKQAKLFELLKIIDGVYSSSWNMTKEIVKNITKKESKIILKEWHDNYKNKNPEWYPLDLAEFKTWSTYDACIDLEFSNKDEKLYCTAHIYDGDSYPGCRKELRFTAEFYLPNSFIKTLEEIINYKFNRYLEDLYDDHLESQKLLWITNLKTAILNK